MQLKHFAIVVALIIVFSNIKAACAEELILKLDEAISIALENNPELLIERAKVPISESELLIAKKIPNPSLTHNSSLAENLYEIFGISNTFELGFKRKYRTKVAKLQLEFTRSLINQKQWEISLEVRNAFVDLFIAQEKAKAYEKIYNNNKKLEEISIKREKAGDIARIDVLQTKIELLKVKNKLELANSNILKNQKYLAQLLNLPSDTSIVAQNLFELENNIHCSFKEIKLSEAEYKDIAINNSPLLRSLKAEKEVYKARIKLEKANRIPDLTLSSGLMYEKNEGKVNAFIGGEIELPIFSRNKGEINKAKANIEYLNLQESSQEKQLKREIITGIIDLKQQQTSLQRIQNEILPLQLEVLEKARIRYEIGKDPLIISIKAQEDYLEMFLEFINLMNSYQNSLAKFEYHLGQTVLDN